jgi:hypothetical protein
VTFSLYRTSGFLLVSRTPLLATPEVPAVKAYAPEGRSVLGKVNPANVG